MSVEAFVYLVIFVALVLHFVFMLFLLSEQRSVLDVLTKIERNTRKDRP